MSDLAFADFVFVALPAFTADPHFKEQIEAEICRLRAGSEVEYQVFMQRIYNNIRKEKIRAQNPNLTFAERCAAERAAANVAASPVRRPEHLLDFPYVYEGTTTVDENLDIWAMIEMSIPYYLESADLVRENMPHLYAYDDSGARLYLIKSLSIAENQHVYLAYRFAPGEPVYTEMEFKMLVRDWENKNHIPLEPEQMLRFKVIKWGDMVNEKDDIKDELDVWDLCKEAGVPHPNIDRSYSFWNAPVMVMDPLRPIDPAIDNYRDVGVAILHILEKFHTFGCHSDIKPDNIMASFDPVPEYYLIDMGGATTERYFYGYLRKIWSPQYASQVYEKNQVTTAKNDLIELGYTLGIYERLTDWCSRKSFGKSSGRLSGRLPKRKAPDHSNCREDYPPEIDGYMAIINQYPECGLPPTIYCDLAQYLVRI